MTDKIDFGGAPWQAIPRATLRDARLSAKAKGGLVTLLSHDEGWVRSCIGTLRHECNVGRGQAQAIMKELRELGYADLTTEQDSEGKLQSRYVVRAIPTTLEVRTVQSPVGGKPDGTETRRDGNRAAVVEALDVEALDEEPKDAESNTASRSNGNNPNQPTDRQLYFDERFGLGIPAIVKLNRDHGRAAVLSAMEQLYGFPPADPVDDIYGWIATVADFKAVGA